MISMHTTATGLHIHTAAACLGDGRLLPPQLQSQLRTCQWLCCPAAQLLGAGCALCPGWATAGCPERGLLKAHCCLLGSCPCTQAHNIAQQLYGELCFYLNDSQHSTAQLKHRLLQLLAYVLTQESVST